MTLGHARHSLSFLLLLLLRFVVVVTRAEMSFNDNILILETQPGLSCEFPYKEVGTAGWKAHVNKCCALNEVALDTVECIGIAQRINTEAYHYWWQETKDSFVMPTDTHLLIRMLGIGGNLLRANIGKGSYISSAEYLWWGESKAGLTVGRFVQGANRLQFILGGNHCYRNVATYPFDIIRYAYPGLLFPNPVYPADITVTDAQDDGQDTHDEHGSTSFSSSSTSSSTSHISNERQQHVHEHQTECPYSKGPITIGNEVWIGGSSTIFSGVTIGDGAVIGANTVVRDSVPPYAIVVGNPGKIVAYRFSASQIDALLTIRWWDWDIEKIEKETSLLAQENIDYFIEKHLPLAQLELQQQKVEVEEARLYTLTV